MANGDNLTKAERIAKARADLAQRYAENPDQVDAFNARMARLAVAAKRERERIEHLVLGHPRPTEVVTEGKRKGRRRPKRVERPVPLAPDIERAVKLRERWSHKNRGTPETWETATRTHTGALAQLHANGTINNEQLEWAAQIANVYRSIEADVGIKVASLEARVDQSSRPPVIAERIHRVRMHLAYTFWRDMILAPKALVLDMLVGDMIGYSVAAIRHRVHPRKAKRRLLEAIDRWPLAVAHAFSAVDQDVVDTMNMARPVAWSRPVGPTPMPAEYEFARAMEIGRDKTDEPYLLPALDPAFIDDRGYLRPWSEIASVIRERLADGMDEAA